MARFADIALVPGDVSFVAYAFAPEARPYVIRIAASNVSGGFFDRFPRRPIRKVAKDAMVITAAFDVIVVIHIRTIRFSDLELNHFHHMSLSSSHLYNARS